MHIDIWRFYIQNCFPYIYICILFIYLFEPSNPLTVGMLECMVCPCPLLYLPIYCFSFVLPLQFCFSIHLRGGWEEAGKQQAAHDKRLAPSDKTDSDKPSGDQQATNDKRRTTCQDFSKMRVRVCSYMGIECGTTWESRPPQLFAPSQNCREMSST